MRMPQVQSSAECFFFCRPNFLFYLHITLVGRKRPGSFCQKTHADSLSMNLFFCMKKLVTYGEEAPKSWPWSSKRQSNRTPNTAKPFTRLRYCTRLAPVGRTQNRHLKQTPANINRGKATQSRKESLMSRFSGSAHGITERITNVRYLKRKKENKENRTV